MRDKMARGGVRLRVKEAEVASMRDMRVHVNASEAEVGRTVAERKEELDREMHSKGFKTLNSSDQDTFYGNPTYFKNWLGPIVGAKMANPLITDLFNT